jgi:transposase
MKDRFESVWEILEPLLPKREPKAHPLGCHRQPISDRRIAQGIWYLMETGCQWKALDKTTICKHSVAHRRFQEWVEAGVFLRLWQKSLEGFDCLVGLEWQWLCVDGVMNKAPLGGEKNREKSGGSEQTGGQTFGGHRRPWRSVKHRDRWRQQARQQTA